MDASTLSSLGPTTDDTSFSLQLNGNNSNDFLGYGNSISWGSHNGEPGLMIGLGNDPFSGPMAGDLYWVTGSDIIDQATVDTVGTWVNSGSSNENLGWAKQGVQPRKKKSALQQHHDGPPAEDDRSFCHRSTAR